MHLLTCLGVVLSFVEGVSCSCPSQCTCDYHGRNDGTGSRYAPLLATEFPMIPRKRTPTRQPSFESKLLIRNQRGEGLTSISFNLIVFILVAHFVVFVLSSLALKSPQIIGDSQIHSVLQKYSLHSYSQNVCFRRSS